MLYPLNVNIQFADEFDTDYFAKLSYVQLRFYTQALKILNVFGENHELERWGCGPWNASKWMCTVKSDTFKHVT